MFRRIARRRHTRPSITRLMIANLIVALLGALLVLPSTPAAAVDEGSGPDPTSAYTGSVTSANARFVVAAYQAALDRDPDTSGLDFHLARLVAGGAVSRQAITYSLLFSTEGSAQEVERAYQDLLDRAPDSTGASYWTAHLQGHGVLDLRILLLSSDEYHAGAGGTDQAWIESLYTDILGRAADSGGLVYWLERAGSGVARPLIVAGIHQSDEALRRRAGAYYQEVLGRSPGTAEADGAADTIRRIGERGLRAQLLASDEAYEIHLQAALS